MQLEVETGPQVPSAEQVRDWVPVKIAGQGSVVVVERAVGGQRSPLRISARQRFGDWLREKV